MSEAHELGPFVEGEVWLLGRLAAVFTSTPPKHHARACSMQEGRFLESSLPKVQLALGQVRTRI